MNSKKMEKSENDNNLENELEKKNEDGILFTKEKISINFDSLYQEIKESEIEACQTRIETYELKGFNSMEPFIKINNNKEKEIITVSSLLEKKNIDNNYIELMKLTEKDLLIFDNIHYGKIKIKQNNFDKINLEEIKINKYAILI